MADPAHSGTSVKDSRSNNSVTQVDLGICIKNEPNTKLQPFQDKEIFDNFKGEGSSFKEEVISSDIKEELVDEKNELYTELKKEPEHEEDEMYIDFEAVNDLVKKEILVSEIKTEFEHEEDEMYIDFEAVNDLVKEEFIPSNVKEEPKGIDNVSFQAQNKQD